MKLYFLTGLLALLPLASVQAQPTVQKETLLYSVKEKDSLRLDRYWVPGQTEPAPCLIFVFGGGFYSGSRDEAYYIPYFEFMARKGFQVVSIDYRLGFKGMVWPGKDEKKPTKRQMVAFIEHVIDIAVEDFFDATCFVVSRAGEWGVDTAKIIGNGSSAGAIAVLQGAHHIANGHELAQLLPKNFTYAGMVSFAGAIFSPKGGLKWDAAPCPLMLFHGDADGNVPYDKAAIFGIGLFGSERIVKRLNKLGGASYWFYSVENTDHELAKTPMHIYREDILSFIDKYVEEGEPLVIRTDVHPLDKPVVNKRFGLRDYLKNNFHPAD